MKHCYPSTDLAAPRPRPVRVTPRDPASHGAALATLGLILGLVVAALCLSGCASVKLEHVEKLQAALLDERLSVTVRPGFEAAVKKTRDEEDNLLVQMKAACK